MSDTRIGQRVEVLPGYDSVIGERCIYDEIAGCEGRITGMDGHYAVLDIGGDEYHVALTRLRFRMPT